MTVPNDYNRLQETLRRGAGLPPWWFAPPHHFNYFTLASLTGLLTRMGFKELARGTALPMELFALMGDIGDGARTGAGHEAFAGFDRAFSNAGVPQVRKLIYTALAEAELRREAIVVARKTP